SRTREAAGPAQREDGRHSTTGPLLTRRYPQFSALIDRTAARAPDDVVVNPDVILGHAVGREALLKAVAHAPTIEHGGAIDRAQCIIRIDHEIGRASCRERV